MAKLLAAAVDRGFLFPISPIGTRGTGVTFLARSSSAVGHIRAFSWRSAYRGYLLRGDGGASRQVLCSYCSPVLRKSSPNRVSIGHRPSQGLWSPIRLLSSPSSPDGAKSPSAMTNASGHQAEEDKSRPSRKPIAQRLELAREQTRAVKDRVKSTLTSRTTHENIYNLPNFLTVTRLFAAPATAYLLLHDHHKYALALFAYAGITDLIDGWMARKWKLQTVAGSVIDPMADKALMIVLTVTLAVKGLLPAYLATLILGRDAVLAIAAIYYRYASLPVPKTFMRYWDFSLPSAEVHPTTVSKYNTFLQLILIGSTLALPVVTGGGQYAGVLHDLLGLEDGVVMVGMQWFQYLVAGTTLWSGLSYAVLKDAVTILGRDEVLKAKQGRRGRGIIGVGFGGVVVLAVYLAFGVDGEPGDGSGEEQTVRR